MTQPQQQYYGSGNESTHHQQHGFAAFEGAGSQPANRHNDSTQLSDLTTMSSYSDGQPWSSPLNPSSGQQTPAAHTTAEKPALSLSQRAQLAQPNIPAQQPVSSFLSSANSGGDPPENTSPEELDGETLERLVNRVVYGVLDRLKDDHFIEKFTKSRELYEDNRQLASQIQQLIRDKKQQQSEMAFLRQEIKSFKRILGNIYLKMD